MASELATRAPLSQKQHTKADVIGQDVAKFNELYATGNPYLTSLADRSNVSLKTEYPGKCHTVGENYPYPAFSFPCNGGFRYQIRRKVESWKFVETKKQDGSILYLCRVCSSSYKHKKSLNKHWKDKHSEVPRPAGLQLEDEEDEEEEDSDEEGLCMGNVSVTEGENIENLAPHGRTSFNVTRVTTPVASAALPTSVSMLAGVRRTSFPLKRPLNRPLQSNRMSFIPSSSLEHPRSPLQSLSWVAHKRMKAEDSTSSTGAVQHVSVNSFLKPHGSSAAEFSTVQLGETQTQSCGSRSKENDGTADRLLLYQSAPNEFISAFSRCDQNPPIPDTRNHPTSMPETKPLDLSVIKQSEASKEHYHRQSEQSFDQYSQKESSVVNKSLLIGLLQTALNTLKSEACKEASADQFTDNPSALSKTSSSLLLAIGTLLVALVDETRQEASAKSTHFASTLNHPAVSYSTEDRPVGSMACAPDDCLFHPFVPGSQQRNCSSPMERLFISVSEASSAPTDTKLLSSPNRRFSNSGAVAGPCSVPSHLLKTHLPYYVQSGEASSIFSHDSNQGINLVNRTDPSVVDTEGLVNDTIEQPPSAEVTSSIGPNETTKTASPPHSDSLRMTNDHGTECTIVCPICKFDARWFSELRAHMVNHSGHRMFGCCYCPYRAKWKWDVAKHMRRCPLGRHVAHLSNESLLRIVRYHPPPLGDILYIYFPQDVFPGVGIDRPPTPPPSNFADNDNRVISSFTNLNADSTIGQIRSCVGLNDNCLRPPVLSRYTSLTNDEHGPGISQVPPTLIRQDVPADSVDNPSEDSPKALIIVDSDVQSPQAAGCSSLTVVETKFQTPPCHSDSTRAFEVPDKEPFQLPETTTSSLVFRLRKCAQCTFRSCDEREFVAHLVMHDPLNCGHLGESST